MSNSASRRHPMRRINSSLNPRIRALMEDAKPAPALTQESPFKLGKIQFGAKNRVNKIVANGELVSMIAVITSPVSIDLGLALVQMMAGEGKNNNGQWEFGHCSKTVDLLKEYEEVPCNFELETPDLVVVGNIEADSLCVTVKSGEPLDGMSEEAIDRLYSCCGNTETQTLIDAYRSYLGRH